MLSLISTSPNTVIKVSELNRLARELLELGVPRVWISGEVSNYLLAASGHAYFSLKDAKAQVRCVLFRQQLFNCPIKPCNGMQVEIKGQVSLYEARGDFQINVESMRGAGLGDMFAAYERLKAQLQTEGLFDSKNKRGLPAYPRAIGVITSVKAAALKDVISTLRRRMPSILLILYPTQVQGDGAAKQIAQAINLAAKRNEVDVLIVTRGGGSLEDLCAFNAEEVARAIAACCIPIISGVGHETDFTICDFVADQRAATPTAAAEIASANRAELLPRLEKIHQQLQRAMARIFQQAQQRIDYLARGLISPQQRLMRQRDAINMLRMRLAHAIQKTFESSQQQLANSGFRLQHQAPDIKKQRNYIAQLQTNLQQTIQQQLAKNARQLSKHQATLLALNPEAVLQRGFAIVQNSNGKAIKSAQEVKLNERIFIQLAKGAIESIVD